MDHGLRDEGDLRMAYLVLLGTFYLVSGSTTQLHYTAALHSCTTDGPAETTQQQPHTQPHTHTAHISMNTRERYSTRTQKLIDMILCIGTPAESCVCVCYIVYLFL